MDNAFIPPIPPELREKVAAEAQRSVEPLLDDLVARTLPSVKGRVILALCRVKRSHGRARREALRELDRVVTELYPPVEGAPLPSVELNGKPDVIPGILICSSEPYTLVGSSAPYWCGPVKPDTIGRFAYPSFYLPFGGVSPLQYKPKL